MLNLYTRKKLPQAFTGTSNSERFRTTKSVFFRAVTSEDDIFDRPYVKEVLGKISNHKTSKYIEEILGLIKLAEQIKLEHDFWALEDIVDYLNRENFSAPGGVKIITQRYIKNIIRKLKQMKIIKRSILEETCSINNI